MADLTTKQDRSGNKEIIIVWARTVLESRLLRVANSLDEEGYSVKVLAWDRESTKPDIEAHEHFDCHYFHLKTPYNSPLVFLLLPLWWLFTIRFLMKHRPDAIHPCDLDCLLPSLFYGKMKRIPVIYDIFDVYGKMTERSVPGPFGKILIRAEAAGARASDAVLMVNRYQHKILGKPALARKLYLINTPYEVDIEKVNHEKTTVMKKIPRKFRDRILIFYGGSVEHARRFDFMLRAIEGMDDVLHVVAGTGADAKELVPIFEESENTLYIGPIPFVEVLAWSTVADILYVLVDSGSEKSRWGEQSRLYTGMMCGTPLIVTADVNAAKVVEENMCGLTVPDNDVDALIAAIKKLGGDSSLRRKLGENGQKAYLKKYRWNILKKGLLDLYSELLK